MGILSCFCSPPARVQPAPSPSAAYTQGENKPHDTSTANNNQSAQRAGNNNVAAVANVDGAASSSSSDFSITTLNMSTLDDYLRPGDILIKNVNVHLNAVSIGAVFIIGGQSVMKGVRSLWLEHMRRSTPQSVHVLVYLGNGRTAEACGAHVDTACVTMRDMRSHDGFLLDVFRPVDPSLAERAAQTAALWANGRMKYDIPMFVPLQSARFGPLARTEAYVLGSHAMSVGGPPCVSKMFCSQFVLSTYQAAVVSRAMEQRKVSEPADITLPSGLDAHASRLAPSEMYARLNDAAKEGVHFKQLNQVLIRDFLTDQYFDQSSSKAANLTGELVNLGIPHAARYRDGSSVYARNVWCMSIYGDSVLIGCGNSNNAGPYPNAGPVDLWQYDIAKEQKEEEEEIKLSQAAHEALDPHHPTPVSLSSRWHNIFSVDDEQIDFFLSSSRGVLIPGHDSNVTGRDSSELEKLLAVPADWAFGNLYRITRKQGSATGFDCQKLRTIPNAIHVYTLCEYNNALYASAATLLGGTVAVSHDDGASWRHTMVTSSPTVRTRLLYVWKQQLYVSAGNGRVYEMKDGKFFETSLNYYPIESDTMHSNKWFMRQAYELSNGNLLYLAVEPLIDHDWVPRGLFMAKSQSSSDISMVRLKFACLPRYVHVHSTDKLQVIYVLGTCIANLNETRNYMFYSLDGGSTFEELFYFDSVSFARCFALEPNTWQWFFGYGCEPLMLSADTGTVVKIKFKHNL